MNTVLLAAPHARYAKSLDVLLTAYNYKVLHIDTLAGVQTLFNELSGSGESLPRIGIVDLSVSAGDFNDPRAFEIPEFLWKRNIACVMYAFHPTAEATEVVLGAGGKGLAQELFNTAFGGKALLDYLEHFFAADPQEIMNPS